MCRGRAAYDYSAMSKPTSRAAAPARLLVALVFLAAQACTAYRPVTGEPELGERIRAQLTPPGQIRQATVTGVARTALEGDVIGVEQDALLLRVPIPGVAPELQRNPKVADTLRVLRSDITGIDMQHFSPLRTGLLAGGIVVVGTVSILAAGHIGSSEGVDDDPGDRTAFRPSFTVIRIPTGR